MSSPARSSASATSAGQGGGSSTNAAFGDDTSPYQFPADLVAPYERKEEALAVLKSDLMEALQKEVKSLDDDNWMFAGPRSQINLISRPGKNLEFPPRYLLPCTESKFNAVIWVLPVTYEQQVPIYRCKLENMER